jgi:hypothetical protein
VEHTLICHTRNISADGCFLDTAEVIAEGVPVVLAIMDNESGEAVQVEGLVARAKGNALNDGSRGIGVRLVAPPPSWARMVERYRRRADTDGPAGRVLRLSVLVVGDEAHRRGALALYVTSGWDVRFAVDLNTAKEALTGGTQLHAVIAEHVKMEKRQQILEEARRLQPKARRIVRCDLRGMAAPPEGSGSVGGPEDLVHEFVDANSGLDALVLAVTHDRTVEVPPQSSMPGPAH